MTGPPVLNLGCGTDHINGAVNVDVSPEADPDIVADLDEVPWPFEDESFHVVFASHVLEHLENAGAALRECERVLVPGGRVSAVLPMGANAFADPDHEAVWTWQTPAFYCGKRHWDEDVGLEVESRDVDLHTHLNGAMGAALRALWWYQLKRFGPGEWCFAQPAMSGEFKVVFSKP